MEKTKKFIIAVYVENKFGVLTRVTGMFTRRGFNIDALAVGETESKDFSRITITFTGDEYAKEQLVNQLNKLHNVKKVDGHHKCLARTKRAIAFAQQLSEIDAYRPEKRFADAVKGLHLYGAKTVYPDEVVLLDLGIAA